MATAFAGTAPAARPRFHLYMAGAVVLIAFGGFIPTYWRPVAGGSFTGQPVMHLHGLLFFAWTLLFFSQSALVAAGRTADHRKWGMLGVGLVGMMTVTVPLAAINSMWAAERLGPHALELARRFTAVPLVSLPIIVGMFGLAIANVHRPEVHRRFMLLMQVPLLQAATGRLVKLALTPPGTPPGPPPGAFVSVPAGLLMDLLIVAAMINDRRTIGRVHPVYAGGLAVLVAEQLLVVPISTSAAWLAFATWLQHLVR